ncbi:hypothetical protein QYF36_001842 [Acer negundo]|nr:hypothetical protein QYF36_001842 [Acer negundo]
MVPCGGSHPIRALHRQLLYSVSYPGDGSVQSGQGALFGPWDLSMTKFYPWLEKVCLKCMSVTEDDLALLAESFLGFKELMLICCDGFGTSSD